MACLSVLYLENWLHCHCWKEPASSRTLVQTCTHVIPISLYVHGSQVGSAEVHPGARACGFLFLFLLHTRTHRCAHADTTNLKYMISADSAMCDCVYMCQTRLII